MMLQSVKFLHYKTHLSHISQYDSHIRVKYFRWKMQGGVINSLLRDTAGGQTGIRESSEQKLSETPYALDKKK